MNLDSEAW